METVLIITGIVTVSSLVVFYFRGMIDAMKEIEVKINLVREDIIDLNTDVNIRDKRLKRILNESLKQGKEDKPPKIEAIPMKNAVDSEDALFVVENDGYMHLCTKDGYILPFNTSIKLTDSVNEPLTATATFHVKKGRIVTP